MTLQLQQAVKLLQMSSVELNEEIQLAHETNPLLELVDELDEPIDTDTYCTQNSSDFDPGIPPQLEFEKINPQDSNAIWDDIQNDTPVDQKSSHSQADQRTDHQDDLQQIPEAMPTLQEMLSNQVIFLLDTENQRIIAHHIIQNINEAGYLDVSLDNIQQQIAEHYPLYMEMDIAEIENVLSMIQGLEPAGVAARSPRECLQIQLQVLNDEADSYSIRGYDIASNIIDHHLQLLGSRDYTKLKKNLQVSASDLIKAVELITRLNPHPGHAFSNTRVDYIVADILVEKSDDIWLARHNPDSQRKLVINRHYLSLISQTQDREQNQARVQEYSHLKAQLKNAEWLLGNIEKRHQTILSVARKIVEKQQQFFHSGLKVMKPMTLSDIASPLGVHESTVFRATTGKYLMAPQGIFELKYFFSSRLVGDDGEAVSSRSIQAVIKNIIDTEDSRRPVSDEKVCTLLAEKGLKVARRTVAKYREQLNIPSSNKRKTITGR